MVGAVEKYICKYFGKRGEHVVQENLMCVRRGLLDVMEIPRAIIEASADSRTANEAVVLAK